MMKIVAGRLSGDMLSCKFIYEKNDKLYIRSGEDDFSKGVRLQSSIGGACSKWGFYKVENPPSMMDAQELMDSVGNFELTNKQTIKFYESS